MNKLVLTYCVGPPAAPGNQLKFVNEELALCWYTGASWLLDDESFGTTSFALIFLVKWCHLKKQGYLKVTQLKWSPHKLCQYEKNNCTFLFTGFSFSLPLCAVVPTCVTLLLSACGARAKDRCAFHDIFPDYLFFECPSVGDYFDYLWQEQVWLWALWFISQIWITGLWWTNEPYTKNRKELSHLIFWFMLFRGVWKNFAWP